MVRLITLDLDLVHSMETALNKGVLQLLFFTFQIRSNMVVRLAAPSASQVDIVLTDNNNSNNINNNNNNNNNNNIFHEPYNIGKEKETLSFR